ncbi:MAG TPA: hypothetical protein VMZ22_12805 [Acidimicrobiales bacterium]|nr:hypothetical protein [Acidimicrobiales bacterium]
MRPEWLAPDAQPFFVESGGQRPKLTLELSDTFRAWRLDPTLGVISLTEDEFSALPRSERASLVRDQVRYGRGAVPTVRAWSDLLEADALRAQADGHRFVWWPSLVDERVLERVATRSPTGAERPFPPSRHAEVKRWPTMVPGARAMAGTFADGSGPNCLSTVMEAAGASGVFDEWLANACRPGGNDDDPGIVLVWRDAEAQPAHAAITLGDGWAFEKPSREWWTRRQVLSIGDLKRGNRVRGWRLERHRIVA